MPRARQRIAERATVGVRDRLRAALRISPSRMKAIGHPYCEKGNKRMLFIAQRFHRVDSRRAACRQIARRQRDQRECRRHADEARRIEWRDAEQEWAKETRHKQGAAKTDRDADA